MTNLLELRPYQQEAVEAVMAAYESGKRAAAVVLPTGTGKTVLSAHILERIRDQRCLFICHRDELIRQTVDKFTMNDPSLRIRVCQAEEGRNASELRGADVIVASAQTIARKPRLQKLLAVRGKGGLVIADELHHYSQQNSWGGAILDIEPDFLVGMSATPKRGDGLGLEKVFGEVVFDRPLVWFVERGYLKRPVGIRIGTTTDLDGVASRQGDFANRELEVRVNTHERNSLIVQAWQQYARDRKSIVFAVDVGHVNSLTAALNAGGARARAIVGTTPLDERQWIYGQFRTGGLNVMVSCNVLLEGFDEPSANCAILARPTQSESLYIQAVGRTLRKYPGMEDSLILDVVDNITRHKLQSIATLAGKEPIERQPKDKEKFDLFAEVRQVRERRTRVREGAERAGSLLESSAMAWVQSPEGNFFIQTNHDWICLIPTQDGTFWPIVAPKSLKKDSWRPLFHKPVDIETAMARGESLVPKGVFTEKDQRWRRQPMTPQQLMMANKYKVAVNGRMTRGEAGDAIDAHFGDKTVKRLKIIEALAKEKVS